jgi:hypothetical protein
VKGEVMKIEVEIWVGINEAGEYVIAQDRDGVTDAMDGLLSVPCSLYKLLVPLELPTAKQVKVDPKSIQEVTCDD